MLGLEHLSFGMRARYRLFQQRGCITNIAVSINNTQIVPAAANFQNVFINGGRYSSAFCALGRNVWEPYP